MRWSVVRLIATKEFRDLLRDRRTVMLILVLPAVLYPVFGLGGLVMVKTLMGQKRVLAVVGADHLPDPAAGFPAFPPPPTDDQEPVTDGSPDLGPAGATMPATVVRMDGDPDELLRTKQADAVLVVPPGFAADLAAVKRPRLTVRGRDGEDKSKIAVRRLVALVKRWEGQLREKRFIDRGLPKDFDKLFTVDDPQTSKPQDKRAADELRDVFARVIPFLLMMWMLTGAI